VPGGEIAAGASTEKEKLPAQTCSGRQAGSSTSAGFMGSIHGLAIALDFAVDIRAGRQAGLVHVLNVVSLGYACTGLEVFVYVATTRP
jgi:hypothetical protein